MKLQLRKKGRFDKSKESRVRKKEKNGFWTKLQRRLKSGICIGIFLNFIYCLLLFYLFSPYRANSDGNGRAGRLFYLGAWYDSKGDVFCHGHPPPSRSPGWACTLWSSRWADENFYSVASLCVEFIGAHPQVLAWNELPKSLTEKQVAQLEEPAWKVNNRWLIYIALAVLKWW